MGKLLSWVVLLVLAWLVIRLLAISQRRRERGLRSDPDAGANAAASSSSATRPAAQGERILPCAHCGVFVPVSDLVRDGDAVYCSTAHRAAARVGKQSPASTDVRQTSGQAKS